MQIQVLLFLGIHPTFTRLKLSCTALYTDFSSLFSGFFTFTMKAVRSAPFHGRCSIWGNSLHQSLCGSFNLTATIEKWLWLKCEVFCKLGFSISTSVLGLHLLLVSMLIHFWLQVRFCLNLQAKANPAWIATLLGGHRRLYLGSSWMPSFVVGECLLDQTPLGPKWVGYLNITFATMCSQ